jgi:glycosyltransferase involved in cell wall biosynthesis
MNPLRKKTLVAIMQPYIPLYRVPIFNLLSRQKHPAPEYTLFADTRSGINVKTIDAEISSVAPEEGGLRWHFTTTYWFGEIYYWQSKNIWLAFSRRYDVIIYPGYMYDLSLWISIVLARISGKRVLMWSHGILQTERSLKGFIRRCFYRLADGLLLYGHHAKHLLMAAGFEPNKLYVVYNSLDYESQQRVRSRLSHRDNYELKRRTFSEPEWPLLIFVGRLTARKRLDLLIKAIRYLHEMDFFANAVIVGDGPERENLERHASRLGVAQYIKYVGESFDENLIGSWMYAADVCVSPGEVGLTAMHALAYGTPVITHGDLVHQMPEVEAIDPGKTGLFFKRGSAVDLAKVIKQWISANEARETVRQRCINIMENYYNPRIQAKIISAAVLGDPIDRVPQRK